MPASSRWTSSPRVLPRNGPAGESNPDLLVASQASSHWTSRPIEILVPRGPPESRTRSTSLQERDAPGTPADHHRHHNENQSSRRESNPRFLRVKEVSSPLDHGTSPRRSFSSSTGGIRTHRHQTLSLTAMPVRVPCRRSGALTASRIAPNCGPGSRTTASEFMRLGRAPARPQSNPRPRYRAGRPAL